MEKLTVHTGPIRYRTSFESCSHGYAVVSFPNIRVKQAKESLVCLQITNTAKWGVIYTWNLRNNIEKINGEF